MELIRVDLIITDASGGPPTRIPRGQQPTSYFKIGECVDFSLLNLYKNKINFNLICSDSNNGKILLTNCQLGSPNGEGNGIWEL